jgi:hypothetical protein
LYDTAHGHECTLEDLSGYMGIQKIIIMIIHGTASLFLLVRSKLLQLLKRDLVQGLLVRGIQEDLGHDLRTLWVVLVCIESFSPSA